MMNRREFLMSAAAAGFVGQTIGAEKSCASNGAGGKGGEILFGVCGSLKNAKIFKAHGYDFIESSVANVLKPNSSEEEWKKQKDVILNAPIPLRSCNGFIPGTFRITGPEAKFGPALDYAEKALRRAEEVGVKIIVFGSGGARNVPGDFCGGRKRSPDIEGGMKQFTEFCRLLCRRVDDLKNVQVVIEPLRPNESNVINYVWQGMQVVREVKHPRLQELADFYHMLSGRESASSIIDAGDSLKHCHIASRGTRRYPGSNPNDALRRIGYAGGVSCECGWPKDKNEYEKALDTALALMKSLA